ncbi:unnamed protein product, partial [Aphanomyces euteiches]
TKTAFILALAATAAADKVAVRLNRFFEANTESVVSTPTVVKVKLDIAALEKGAAAAADPRQFVYDFLNKASEENLKTLSSVIDVKDVQSIPIGGAFVVPNGSKDITNKLSSVSSVRYLDLNAADFSNPDVLKNNKEVAREAAKNEWGVETVGAPSIWKYYNGSGALVGSLTVVCCTLTRLSRTTGVRNLVGLILTTRPVCLGTRVAMAPTLLVQWLAPTALV